MRAQKRYEYTPKLQSLRVAELARDVPEVAAIFAEFDRLIQRRAIQP